MNEIILLGILKSLVLIVAFLICIPLIYLVGKDKGREEYKIECEKERSNSKTRVHFIDAD